MYSKEALKAKLAEVRVELDGLKSKVDAEAQKQLEATEAKIEAALGKFDKEFDDELAEFKEVGLFGWIASNPLKALFLVGLTAAAANGVLALFGLNLGL